VASKNKTIRWFRANARFPYRFHKVKTELHECSCAHDYFEKGTVSKESETVLGEAWINDWNAPKDLILYEQAIPLSSYDTVLSLVWLY
jgi:hypothetical protein